MRKKDFTAMPNPEIVDPLAFEAADILMDIAKDQGLCNVGYRESNSSSSDSCGFDAGFSVIHFLSAIRFVLTTPLASPVEEAAEGNSSIESYEQGDNSMSTAVECLQRGFPCYTTQEIVEKVKQVPGDARVLELRLRLEDLVRGVLRIFSSKIAPKGVYSWKPLTMYERFSGTWSWIGPIPSRAPKTDRSLTVACPGAWNLKGQTVKKLVNCFSGWLKESLDVLQEFGRLPPPPSQLMQPSRDPERFNRTRNLKISLSTIIPSCEQVRDYFRKEEALRYTIPERPFAYTTLDGRKASVAPFRRRSGKPSRKARDHFILKSNRPPCFTVLSLVRDAVARLPDGLGTRADVCILVRDSAYIIEDISDDQVEQVVSGALDRLHYERDACVRFDRNTKLWIYLHGSRGEEDFEDDGTHSKKIRKKIKSRRQHG